MTLKEFFDDYVPSVLFPLGGWVFTASGHVRRRTDHGPFQCPLTAERGLPSGDHADEAERIGLSKYDAVAVVAAADGGYSPETRSRVASGPPSGDRARLLAGLGLQ